MPDIVDELRKLPGDRCRPCLEAADEIERLRVNLRLADAGFMWGPPTLTDAEREAVDRVRIAFRDMDHNDMTMQQIEDYEAICDLLERTK